jgi:DNA-binding SARP family transcriptional activator
MGERRVMALGENARPDGDAVGVIVLNASGALVACNDEAVALVGRIPKARFGRSVCCQLFGCRTPTTPLADNCLTELALEGGQAPAVLMETPDGLEAPVWVSASSAGHPVPLVTLTVRGSALTSGGTAERHTVRIRTLGDTTVLGVPGDGDWIEQRAGQLLKFLLCHRRHVVRSEAIGDALWPELGIRAGANVRYFIRTLRNHLEPARPPGAPSSFVVAARGGYALSTGIEVDADEFERLANDGASAFALGDASTAQLLLERALAMYGGEFLADEPYAEWALAERERLHKLAADSYRLLLRMHVSAGELDAAARCADKLVALEPWDAEVQRAQLVLCLRRGRRSEALRRYRHLERSYRREFGDQPEFTLAELAPDHDLGLV